MVVGTIIEWIDGWMRDVEWKPIGLIYLQFQLIVILN